MAGRPSRLYNCIGATGLLAAPHEALTVSNIFRPWLDRSWFLGRAIQNQKSGMAHEIAKLLLEHAGTFLERAEAIRVAMSLGMPLHEIEEYLDWLDANRGPLPPAPDEEEPTDD